MADELAVVRGRLARMRGTIRSLLMTEGLARVLLVAAAFLAVTFILDYFLVLPSDVRLVLLVLGAAWVGVVLVKKVLYRALIRISDDDLALFVERNNPQLEERLISAIQLSRETGRDEGFNSPELVRAVIEDATQASSTIDYRRMFVRRDVHQVAVKAITVLVILAALAVGFHEYSAIYFQRLVGMNVRWPQMIRLHVLDFGEDNRRVVARGDDLVIAVRAERVRAGASYPRKAWIEYQFSSGERGRELMTPFAVDRFKYELQGVTGDFRFQVVGGDDRTDAHFVRTLNPPSLEQILLFYTYPKYLRLDDTPPDRPEAGGSIAAPLLTGVRFEARVDEPLASAELILRHSKRTERRELAVELDASGAARRVRAEFEVVADLREYSLVFRAENGLENRDPVRFAVRGQTDKAPEIKVHELFDTEHISEFCIRPMELDVEDDFGIQEIGMEVKVVGREETDWVYRAFTQEDNQGTAYGAPRIHTRFLPGLDVKKLGVKPGDFVRVRFRASDYKDIGQRNVTVTKEYRFEVIPLVELQKRLEADIEKIKAELEKTQRRQNGLYTTVGRFLTKRGFGEKDRLTSLEAGEVRESALEQNGVTNRVQRAGRDIKRVHRRGVYNQVFEEEAARELLRARLALEVLVEIEQQPGPSPLAAAHLQEGSKTRIAASRREAFREAQNMQSIVLEGIKDALTYLRRWSTYQEVVRLTRRAYEAQRKVNEEIKKKPE
ncbi:MAG: hypothetical protein ACYTAF_00050 [Planctomycetota bacterium]|jgi:hypothetical protein